jgi:hypothetical protein
MATVFLVGELGPGHRDLPPLIRLGHALNAKRHRVVLVVRDVMGATFMLRNQEGFRVLQAPVWRAGKDKRDVAGLTNYGDYLGSVGLDDPDEIARMVGAWRKIMDNTTPDLIIAHNSPGACLAAAGRTPVIALGDGFTVPPAGIEAFPELIAGRQPAYDQNVLLDNVNSVLRHRRAPGLRSLPSLFFTAGRFPFVLPGLDPYRGWRTRPARGPMDALPEPQARPEAPYAFVSLATEFYEADIALSALVEKGMEGTAFLRRVSADFLDGLSWKGIDVVTRGPDPLDAVRRASLVVHDGSVGLTTLATAVGRPQLIFPTCAENAVTAARAAELGVAIVVQGDPTPERIVGQLEETDKLSSHAAQVAMGLDRGALGNGGVAAEAKCIRVLAA